jgi:hypothetical protein
MTSKDDQYPTKEFETCACVGRGARDARQDRNGDTNVSLRVGCSNTNVSIQVGRTGTSVWLLARKNRQSKVHYRQNDCLAWTNFRKKLFDDKAQTAAWYEHTHKIISSIASALTKQEKFYEAVALRRVISAASKQQLAAACEQLEELNRSRPHVSAVPKRTIGVDQTLEKFTMTQDEVDEAESLLHCVLATFGPRHRYVLLTKRCLALLQEQKTATRVAKRVSRVASTVAKKRKVIG